MAARKGEFDTDLVLTTLAILALLILFVVVAWPNFVAGVAVGVVGLWGFMRTIRDAVLLECGSGHRFMVRVRDWETFSGQSVECPFCASPVETPAPTAGVDYPTL